MAYNLSPEAIQNRIRIVGIVLTITAIIIYYNTKNYTIPLALIIGTTGSFIYAYRFSKQLEKNKQNEK